MVSKPIICTRKSDGGRKDILAGKQISTQHPVVCLHSLPVTLRLYLHSPLLLLLLLLYCYSASSTVCWRWWPGTMTPLPVLVLLPACHKSSLNWAHSSDSDPSWKQRWCHVSLLLSSRPQIDYRFVKLPFKAGIKMDWSLLLLLFYCIYETFIPSVTAFSVYSLIFPSSDQSLPPPTAPSWSIDPPARLPIWLTGLYIDHASLWQLIGPEQTDRFIDTRFASSHCQLCCWIGLLISNKVLKYWWMIRVITSTWFDVVILQTAE